MNLNLYRSQGKWLMVDLGVTFGDDSMPGIEVVMPDPSFIVERKDELVGLVLTHAHEDHLGAVPYLWQQLRCPIYATPFTASVLRRKLEDTDFGREVEITIVPMSGRFDVGPFEIELVTLTHSIPEPNALVIRTGGAKPILHTGDWKFDPDPLVGPTSDEARLQEIGEEGVLALIGDSTNVFRAGSAGSEADVRKNMIELVAKYKTNRVAVACFASNVARLETMAKVAEANGRHPALIGRSLWRMTASAKENGYLQGIDFVSEHDAGFLPKDKVLLICTGSQGEPRAALSRIVSDSHPHVTLEGGDTVIFSSRVIPGNEKSIARVQNALIRRNIEVVTATNDDIHVSGHPARDELIRMYQHVRPEVAIPVHGESRHLIEHAKLARECQVPVALSIANGDVVRLHPGPAEVVDEVFAGRLAVDGKRLVSLGDPVLRDRNRLMHSGAIVMTIVLDKAGKLRTDPMGSFQGVLEGEDPMREDIIDIAADAVEGLRAADRKDDAAVAEAVRIAVRRAINAELGRKPVTDVHVVRLA
ncbi:MBL fold metallo-hydrolase [Oceanibaculum pacificum]|uniref:MBL fold metallo-hydrolase n=2 Tax=Oceanibaculum pacificum TaxID=580166 RepID=A0A154W8M2_9PROT|nr:MBL fold metallo-hydrolase [Oceanibaculum pacificum]